MNWNAGNSRDAADLAVMNIGIDLGKNGQP
jgi:hypothetical protein